MRGVVSIGPGSSSCRRRHWSAETGDHAVLCWLTRIEVEHRHAGFEEVGDIGAAMLGLRDAWRAEVERDVVGTAADENGLVDAWPIRIDDHDLVREEADDIDPGLP